jgi:2,3-dihydroxyphenylpropionate 1,2-dioxygenase
MISRFAGLSSSHAPLAMTVGLDPDGQTHFSRSLAALGADVRAFAPDLIVMFGPDHFNGFFYDAMPNFCLGAAANPVGDWGTSRTPLDVPKTLALALLEAVRSADIDLDMSFAMGVDHGFTQIWEMMLGRADAIPIVPIMINCAAPPRPTVRRARMLGDAVGRFFASRRDKVLFAGSGGLSHDPPIPQLDTANEQQHRLIMAGRNLSADARAAREARVIEAAAAGHGVATLAPDADWDRKVIDILRSGRLEEFDSWSDEEISAAGGGGGHEIRTWIAAAAALNAAAGEVVPVEVDYHELVEQWITGMGVVRAGLIRSEGK